MQEGGGWRTNPRPAALRCAHGGAPKDMEAQQEGAEACRVEST
jgi:hypothetical protein